MRVPRFLVQTNSEQSGFRAGVPRSLLGKFAGWNVAQRSVRSTLVIVPDRELTKLRRPLN